MSEKWKLSDPYVYQALMGLHNQSLAVQTTHGSVRGVLREVMPDHIECPDHYAFLDVRTFPTLILFFRS